MFGNVILAGGSSMLPGFAARLQAELRPMAAATIPINVIASPTRYLATWLGASILASAHNFNSHWVSRDEVRFELDF